MCNAITVDSVGINGPIKVLIKYALVWCLFKSVTESQRGNHIGSYRWLKEYIHNPSYYHHQIGSIHLSHCCHIFPWLCVWDGCTIIFCHLLHIYPGKTGTLFPFLMFSLWYLQTIGYIMACRSCSFVCRLHHLIIIIMQTYLKALNYSNACQVYAAECVSKIKKILSIIFYSIYGAVCLQLTYFSCDDRENVYFILLSSSNRKYESLTIV